jgi:hypothetical protein
VDNISRSQGLVHDGALARHPATCVHVGAKLSGPIHTVGGTYERDITSVTLHAGSSQSRVISNRPYNVHIGSCCSDAQRRDRH